MTDGATKAVKHAGGCAAAAAACCCLLQVIRWATANEGLRIVQIRCTPQRQRAGQSQSHRDRIRTAGTRRRANNGGVFLAALPSSSAEEAVNEAQSALFAIMRSLEKSGPLAPGSRARWTLRVFGRTGSWASESGARALEPGGSEAIDGPVHVLQFVEDGPSVDR